MEISKRVSSIKMCPHGSYRQTGLPERRKDAKAYGMF
jgi:hypothetical protein